MGLNDRGGEGRQPSEVAEALRKRGNRITPQRQAILEIIHEEGGHLSADEIYYLARRKVPRLSLSTVYRSLDLLKELDLVSELQLAGDHCRYEALNLEHQHLVCLGCGAVVEFLCSHCSEVHRALADQHRFRITSSRVELFGYCEECIEARRN